VDETASTPVLRAVIERPATLNHKFFLKNPLPLDTSSTQYPDDGCAANTHTYNYPWSPIVRSFFPKKTAAAEPFKSRWTNTARFKHLAAIPDQQRFAS